MEDLAIIILTLDEEANIAKAIASVAGRAKVIVVDSGSRDATLALAREGGAEVHEHAFVDYASQRNWALEQAQSRFRWAFFLDADEELTPALLGEIEAMIARADLDAAYVGLTFVVLGRELRHGGFRDASILRLMRPELARFSRGTNERVDDSKLRVGKLVNKLRHDDHKPLAEWFRKHVRYAQREARHYVDGDDRKRGLDGFSMRTKAGRTIGVRWAYNKMPLFLRPFVHFGRTVMAQSAWRDGIPGLFYASMQSLWYPLMIDLFIYEARWHDKLAREEHER
ncbi:MAG: glycosyltransferase family 2 protein [Deltaproteobacteria bacterium]|nr:glycosyltransferase family 2 protein [Nannocystaceae bacterium]